MVLFDEPPALDSLVVERSKQPLVPAGDDRTRTWHSGAERLQITAGTAFLPPPGAAARIRSLQGGGEADEASRNMLIELGYIEEDEGGEDHGHGGDPDADASDSGAPDVGSDVPNCY